MGWDPKLLTNSGRLTEKIHMAEFFEKQSKKRKNFAARESVPFFRCLAPSLNSPLDILPLWHKGSANGLAKSGGHLILTLSRSLSSFFLSPPFSFAFSEQWFDGISHCNPSAGYINPRIKFWNRLFRKKRSFYKSWINFLLNWNETFFRIEKLNLQGSSLVAIIVGFPCI